jgi:hypothetical protein
VEHLQKRRKKARRSWIKHRGRRKCGDMWRRRTKQGATTRSTAARGTALGSFLLMDLSGGIQKPESFGCNLFFDL